MILDNFRHRLRQEVELWREEGLIDNLQYEQLAQRYQFDKLDMFARNRFVLILVALGSILLGLGVITFVAANWQAWSKTVKLTLLLCLFFVANIVGFYLWRQPNRYNIALKKLPGQNQILGEGLLIFAALILGANMALIGQIFHVNGSLSQLFLAWGIGVLLMSYSLRLTSLGVVAIIIIQLGYWTGYDYYSAYSIWTQLITQHMPLIAWIIFIPLAYVCRSPLIFVLGAIAATISIPFNLEQIYSSDTLKLVNSLAFVLPPALLWSYDDLAFRLVNYRLFQPLAKTLTLLYLSIIFYILSFHWLWEISSSNYHQSSEYISLFLTKYPVVDIIILSLLALWQWWNLLSKKYDTRQQIDLTTIAINYNISRVDYLRQLPGWDKLVKQYPSSDKAYNPLADGISLYVILQKPNTTLTPWKPVGVSGTLPALTADQVVLKGRYQYGFINYNLETYYVPEEQISQVNKNLSLHRQQGRQVTMVEAKVDHEGDAVPVSIWIGDKNYNY